MSACDCANQPSDPDRRHFLTRAAMATVGSMLLSSCGALVEAFKPSNNGDLPAGGPLTITVADYPALTAVGGTALLRNVPVPMAAVRTDATTILVFSRYCPHQGSLIGISGAGFRCPNHGATFDNQGSNTGGFRTGSLRRYIATYDPITDILTIS